MVFVLESIIACVVFTLFVFLMSRDPVKTIFNYPPAILERCDQLGLVDAGNKPGGAVFMQRRLLSFYNILWNTCQSKNTTRLQPS